MDDNIFQSLGPNGIADTSHGDAMLQGMAAAPGQQAPAVAPAGSGRTSLFDIIGRVGDVFAKVGGSTPLYQSTMDADLARQQAAEDRPRQVDLENLKAQLIKSQIGKSDADVAEARGKLDTSHAALIGAGAKGLRAAFTKTGADGVNRAWPLLAQQLHLSPEDTQAVAQHLADDPDSTIAALEATAAKAGAGKDGNEYGLVPFYTRDAQGNLHIRFPSKSGDTNEPDLGGQTPVDPVKVIDNGGTNMVVGSKTGTVQRIVPKTGKPAEGTRPIVGPNGQITGYTALPLTDTQGNVVGTATDPKGAAVDQRKQAANATKSYQSYKTADDALANLDRSLLELRNDPNLAGATGLVGGKLNLTPAQRNFHAHIEAVAGQGIPAAIAAIKAAGGAAPRAVSEITGEANGLVGPLRNRDQDAAAYVQQIDAARARLRNRRLQMAQEYKGSAQPAAQPAPKPAASTARPPARILPRGPQRTVRPTISNW